MNKHILGRSADHKLRNKVVKIDLVVVLVSVFVLMVLVGYARPLVIAPLDEYKSLDGEVLFEFERPPLDSLLHRTGQGLVLLVDDNMDFTTPDEYDVEDGLRVELEPGVYYWKVSGILGSEVRKLTIMSRVELALVEMGEGFGVVNAGNVRLNVDVYDGDELVEKVRLGVGESRESGVGSRESEDKFVGEYDE